MLDISVRSGSGSGITNINFLELELELKLFYIGSGTRTRIKFIYKEELKLEQKWRQWNRIRTGIEINAGTKITRIANNNY